MNLYNMATLPHGFPTSIFVENSDPDFICCKCHHVLRNPMQTTCGHRFCKECIDYILGSNSICPTCLEEEPDIDHIQLTVSSIYPDNGVNRKLRKCKVKCFNEECSWSDIFCKLEEHLIHSEPCRGDIIVVDPRDKRLKEIQETVSIMSDEIKKLSEAMTTSETALLAERKRNDEIDEKVLIMKRKLALKEVLIEELKLKVDRLETVSYDGIITWKISDVSQKRQDAIDGKTPSIYSPPFYTSKAGYKMCGRVYLNGDGMGKGTHLSIFFVIMRGQYDAILSWPFNRKVTIILLDHNNKDHVLDAFRPDPTSTSFARPTTEMNIASGCPLFAPWTNLNNHDLGYIKDNTLFIRIHVESLNID
jgi:hypothetical protein